MLGAFRNLNDKDPRLSEIFLTVSIWHGNRWFYLARYFDSDYGKRGPRALARSLNRPLKAVFPVRYDLRPLVKSRPEPERANHQVASHATVAGKDHCSRRGFRLALIQP